MFVIRSLCLSKDASSQNYAQIYDERQFTENMLNERRTNDHSKEEIDQLGASYCLSSGIEDTYAVRRVNSGLWRDIRIELYIRLYAREENRLHMEMGVPVP
ncbi:hypothetical protein Tco_1056712 [Tanacetum coccineum]|uniref:Uncharacterized protein n=1 Tax=Tanacetum coccineum TaxID=301880 RepID=A0ABQ5H3A7_9ASTR